MVPHGAHGAGGELRGLLGVGRDVTDQRRFEREARHAQKMEAVGTLAAGIAHDFNNLLMGIMGMAEMAENRLHDPEMVASHIREIRNATKSGVSIVSQLLTFSKRSALERTEVEVDRALEASAAMLGTLLGEGVRLETSLDAKGARVLLAPGHLEQIMMNLAANARHAMPSGGVFSVETSWTSLDPDEARAKEVRPGRFLRLRVCDTGIGMDEPTRARVFEPFFTTKRDAGTGLGLSTIYGIVRGCEGHVEVESSPGVATTFTLLLPHARTCEALERPPQQVQLGQDEPTVLIVEDEELVRMTVCHYLCKAGYAVREAASAEQALELCRAHRVAAVLSDAALPGLSGPELIHRLEQEGLQIPVALMSAYPRDVLLERHERIPPETPTIQKPFSQEEAVALVDRLVKADEASAPPAEVTGCEISVPPVVLLLEDNAVARSAVEELFADLRYELMAASDIGDALELVQARGGVDLVLTDIRLPDGTGPELIERLRKIYPGARAVYVSGLPRDEEIDAVVERHRAVFVQKPVDFSTLAEVVERQLAAD